MSEEPTDFELGVHAGRRLAAEAVSVYRDKVLADLGSESRTASTLRGIANEWLTRARSEALGSAALPLSSSAGSPS